MKTSPLKAIRAYCLGCGGDSAHEVKLCPCKDCELYPFRFGKNPYFKRTPMSEERKKEVAENLRKFRERKKAEKENE